jgi:hypothetical protein
MQAAHFISTLDSSRFAHYRSETYNACKLRGAVFPPTLADAFREATAHVIVSPTQTVVPAGVFVTASKHKGKGKDTESSHKDKQKDKDKGKSKHEGKGEKKTPPKPCPLCKNGMHWKEDCPDKQAYEDALQRVRDDFARKKAPHEPAARTYFATVPDDDSAHF